jgi:hypothetical protein
MAKRGVGVPPMRTAVASSIFFEGRFAIAHGPDAHATSYAARRVGVVGKGCTDATCV